MRTFISEPLHPVPGTFDPAGMSRGEPGLPRRFVWRKREYAVLTVLETWKTSTADRGELYLRRHWFKVAADDGSKMTLYCDRQAQNPRRPRQRWWVYAVESPTDPVAPSPVTAPVAVYDPPRC